MKNKEKKKMKIKAIVLFSGGLDSRLAIKLLQDQKINIMALFFLFPFGSGCCNPNCSFNFAQTQNIKLKIIDCTKGKLFKEYIKIIKKPKYGYGSAINPCIDCRIFMLKKAKKIMEKEKADFIATGEVLNERPMSQRRKILYLTEKESKLKGKLLRPLSAKLLPETIAEKKGLINRKKLLAIQGRQRKIQMALAKKHKISYPTPAGGCILCEKTFASKLKDLFKHKKKIEPRDIELLKLGRHFRYKNNKIIIGRNEQENNKLMALAKNKDLVFEVKIWPGPITLLEGKSNKKIIEIAAALTLSHSDAKHKKQAIIQYGKGKRKFNKVINAFLFSQKEVEKLRIR